MTSPDADEKIERIKQSLRRHLRSPLLLREETDYTEGFAEGIRLSIEVIEKECEDDDS